MKRKNNWVNRLTGSSKSQLECSAGQMTFILLSKNEAVTSREAEDYLRSIHNLRVREIYDSLRLKLFRIIDYFPKIV